MIRVISELKLFIFFSPPHTNTQILLSAHGTFFHCLKPFSEFSSQSNPHSKYLFLILRNTRFHNRFYMAFFISIFFPWIVTSLKIGQIQQFQSKLFIFCSAYIKTANISYSKKDILLIPLKKTFTLSRPHNNYPHSLLSIYWEKLDLTKNYCLL